MKNILTIISFLSALIISDSCKKENISVSGIELSYQSLNLTVDEIKELTVKVLPENANDKTIEWSSSNTSVASVEAGVVTALSVGEAVISAKAKSSNVSASCKVTVSPVPVNSITLDRTSIDLYVGEKGQINCTVLPENATNKNFSWSSSNSAVAKVDNNGEVTGISEGETYITAISEDRGITESCKVNVTYRKPESISFEKKFYETTPGQTFKVLPVIGPEYASFNQTYWQSSNEYVATVDGQGNISAHKIGSTIITATTYGLEAAYTLRVKRADIPENAVDLGLPSCTLWSALNIGASKPEQSGGFYAWGELTEKNSYTWDNYKFGTHSNITKYLFDGPGMLQNEDDLANVSLGGSWYIPKMEEFDELIKNTDNQWVENYLGKGISGFIFKGKAEGYENSSIFIPASGYKENVKHQFKKYNAFLWISQNGRGFTSEAYSASSMQIQTAGDENAVYTSIRAHPRYLGFSIRPVNRTN